MTTTELANTDAIVLDYLAALWAQSDDLAPEVRDDLMNTVAEYIAVRRGQIDDPAEILRRLGPPEPLVAAVQRGQMPAHVRLPALVAPPRSQPPALSTGRPAGGVEYTAIGLLTAGAFVLPVISPVAGVLLATGSPHWTAAQKTAAWTLTVGTVAGAAVLAALFSSLSVPAGVAFALIYLATCAGSLVAGMTLLSVVRRQTADG